MHYLNKNDYKNRNKVFKHFFFFNCLKTCILDKRLTFKKRLVLKYSVEKKINRANNSIVKVRNRCVLTGRSRFVLRYFLLSRMTMRSYLGKGYCSGFSKF